MQPSVAFILLICSANLVFGVYAESTTQTETASSVPTSAAADTTKPSPSSDPRTQQPGIESTASLSSDDPNVNVGKVESNKNTTPNVPQVSVDKKHVDMPQVPEKVSSIQTTPTETNTPAASTKTTQKSSATSISLGVSVLVPSLLALILRSIYS